MFNIEPIFPASLVCCAISNITDRPERMTGQLLARVSVPDEPQLIWRCIDREVSWSALVFDSILRVINF